MFTITTWKQSKLQIIIRSKSSRLKILSVLEISVRSLKMFVFINRVRFLNELKISGSFRWFTEFFGNFLKLPFVKILIHEIPTYNFGKTLFY